jgi:hypothetical protein
MNSEDRKVASFHHIGRDVVTTIGDAGCVPGEGTAGVGFCVQYPDRFPVLFCLLIYTNW